LARLQSDYSAHQPWLGHIHIHLVKELSWPIDGSLNDKKLIPETKVVRLLLGCIAVCLAKHR
jgi:hypothetical protein